MVEEKIGKEIKEIYWKPSYPFVVGVFYLLQGLYLTALQVYQSVYMTDVWVLDYGTIAFMTAILFIPGYLKSFTGLLSDGVAFGKFGRRRPYILIGGIAFIPLFLILAFITDFGPPWVVIMVTLTFFWILVDGTLDALSVDVTPPEKKGIIQGAGWGCRSLGAALGSIIVTILALQFGWGVAIITMGVIAILMSFSGILIKEPPVTKGNLPSKKVFKETFSKSNIWIGFIFVVLMMTCVGIMMFIGPFLLRNIEFSLADYGIAMMLMQIGSFVGSLIVGKFSDKYGAKKIIYIISILYWCAIIPWLFLSSGSSLGLVLFITLIFGFVYGGMMVSVMRIAMELSPRAIGGFAFATFASACNFGMVFVGSLMIGAFEPLLGLPVAFFVLIPFTIVGVILLRFIKPWKPESK
jgi:MFS family permease